MNLMFKISPLLSRLASIDPIKIPELTYKGTFLVGIACSPYIYTYMF